MHIRFNWAATSASTLALATAATLALPFSANAADFTYRNGERIATSLELPDEGANLIVNDGSAEQVGITNNVGNLNSGFNKSGAGTLTLSGDSPITGPVTVKNGELNVTGYLSGPVSVENGTLTTTATNSGGRSGRVDTAIVSKLGIFNTNDDTSIGTLTNEGTVVNNGGVYN
ncbi:MAG: autotransporter-associated beta strand repeat-containing protein, partial [Notoacmeibacter sp.]